MNSLNRVEKQTMVSFSGGFSSAVSVEISQGGVIGKCNQQQAGQEMTS